MKRMKKVIALFALVVAGMAMSSQAGAAPSKKLPTHWTPEAETIVKLLASTTPELEPYDPECVLTVIKGEFKSPRNFARTATNHPESPRFISMGTQVVLLCGDV